MLFSSPKTQFFMYIDKVMYVKPKVSAPDYEKYSLILHTGF